MSFAGPAVAVRVGSVRAGGVVPRYGVQDRLVQDGFQGSVRFAPVRFAPARFAPYKSAPESSQLARSG